MKTLLHILLAVTLVCHSALSAVVSTSNPSPLQRGISKDVYIAFRLDGRLGTGTKDDPYDGSTTAKFDTAFNAVAGYNLSTSVNVFIGPGTFTTVGSKGYSLGTAGYSCRIKGAGRGVTTVKLANGTYTAAADGNIAIFRHWDFTGDMAYFEISDLTLDCNAANQPIVSGTDNGDLGAVVVCSKKSYLHDMTVTNVWSRGGETFPICAHSTTGNATENFHVIERVRASAYSGYMTMVSIINQQGGTNYCGGIIRDCVITGNGNYTVGQGQAGIGSGAWDGVLVENNRCANMVAGVVVDTFNYRNVTFRGNVFESCSYGIIYNGSGTYDGVQILNNHFGPKSGSAALLPPSTLPTAQLIMGNKFETDTVGTTNTVSQSVLNYLLGLTNNVQSMINQLKAGGSGSGDVVGPAGAGDNVLVRFDGTTGKQIQTGAAVLDDSGNLALSGGLVTVGNVTATGTVTGANPTVRAQVLFDDSGTILSSYNVSSITVNGPGDFTVNFTSALSTTNYVAQLSGRSPAASPPNVFVENYDNILRTTSALRLYSLRSTTGSPVNSPRYSVTILY